MSIVPVAKSVLNQSLMKVKKLMQRAESDWTLSVDRDRVVQGKCCGSYLDVLVVICNREEFLKDPGEDGVPVGPEQLLTLVGGEHVGEGAQGEHLRRGWRLLVHLLEAGGEHLVQDVFLKKQILGGRT